MSHFLARLVERARRTAPRVEPMVVPRFAPAPIVEVTSEVETPAALQRDQQPAAKEKSSRRADLQQEFLAEKPGANKIPGLEKLTLSPQIVATEGEREKLLVPVAADSRVVRRSEASERPVSLVKNGTVSKKSLVPPPGKRSKLATPVTTTFQRRKRGFVMPNEPREEPPIVRVTIGRIDVRATPPPALSRKSPPRFEPKLTLDAYLKARKEGTR